MPSPALDQPRAPAPGSPFPARAAMTLIELLVVIVILTILVAAAIPLMAPSTSERQLREAVRGLNAFFGAAQARAVANGRPFGVALKRLSQDTGRGTPGDPDNNNGVAVEAFIVEQPAPYSGFSNLSAVQLALDNGASGGAGQVLVRFVRRVSPDTTRRDGLAPGWDPDPLPPGLLRPGDVVEVYGNRFVFIDNGAGFIDAKGFYTTTAGNPVGTLVTRPVLDTGQQLNFAQRDTITTNRFWTAPAAYKILRQPVPTADEPYQLPEGTVVDLRASGVGDTGFFFWPFDPSAPMSPLAVDNVFPVMIMFSPEGRVDRVRLDLRPGGAAGAEVPVLDNIFLLVGPNVPAPPPPVRDPTLTDSGWGAAVTDEQRTALRQPLNWLRGDSSWLVIGAATGRVVTIQNLFVDPASVFNPLTLFSPPLPFTTANESSEELRSYQILAARRFAGGMEQLGGR